MPNFLSNMKLAALVSVEKEEVVSLPELLLSEQAAVYSEVSEKVEDDSTPGVKVKSRRDRRKRGRSATTKGKEKSKTGSSLQKMEQLRQSKKRQDLRKAALLKYQVQKGQTKSTPTSTSAGDGRSSKRVEKKQAEEEANSIEINPALRPVILAIIDFKPLFDSEKNVTAVGNIIKVKRAARALSTENLLDIDTSEQMIEELDFLTAHIANVSQRQTFLNGLDIESMAMYEDAFSAFEIDETSVSSASNTEVLYTLLRDYCFSLNSCTPRLLECSTREFEPGMNLMSDPSTLNPAPNDLRRKLRNNAVSTSNLYSTLPEDSEISLKWMIATVTQEFLFSYNKSVSDVSSPPTSTYDARSKKEGDPVYTFSHYFNLKSGQRSMIPQNHGVTSDNMFGDRNLNGILYPAGSGSGTEHFYPFEKCELIAPTGYKSSNSAPDEVAKLYATRLPKATDGPYTEIATRYSEVKESVDALTTTDSFEFDYAPSVMMLELICRNIVSACLDTLPESSSSSAAKKDALQLSWILSAARDNTAYTWLITFLAFLQDQLTGTAITGEASSSTPLSSLVKNDSGLSNLIGKPSSSDTVKRSFTSTPSDISIDPQPEDFENPTSVDAMTVTQEMDLAEGETSGSSASLLTYFGKSWEELCIAATLGIRGSLNTITDSTLAGSEGISSSTTVKLDDLKDVLVDLATDSDSIFAELISFMDDADSLFGSQVFGETGFSNYSQILRQRLHATLIASIAKATNFYIGDCTIVEGGLSSFFETVSAVSVATAKTSISTSKSRGSFGPRAAASWSSADASTMTIGSSLTFSYAGVTDRKDALTAFLDSQELDTSLIEDYSSSLARCFSGLEEESEFQESFMSSISEYFGDIRDSYQMVVDALLTDIDASDDVEETLLQRISAGLPLSTDMCKMLLNYIRVYDSSDSTYSNIRTRDKALVCSNMSLLSDVFQGQDYCEAGKLKYMVVGIKSGCMDMTREEPIDMEDVDRDTGDTSSSNFVVSLEKVDLTRPDLEYVDKEYSFSRNLFINRVDDSTEGELNVYFDNIDSNFSVTEESESGLDEDEFTDDQIENLRNDFALKLYSDLFLDLDFFEDAYPAGPAEKKALLTGSISMPSLTEIDKELTAFLSGSNIAFDEQQRQIAGFKFYSEGTESLDLKSFQGLDPTAYSVFTYLNSYGNVANASAKKSMLKYGTEFERIVCIPFDPTDFEIDSSSDDEEAAEVDARVAKITEAEEEVGIGLETSQGVELSNFRVYITIPDTEGTES